MKRFLFVKMCPIKVSTAGLTESLFFVETLCRKCTMQ